MRESPQLILQEIESLAEQLKRRGLGGRKGGKPGDLVVVLVSEMPERQRFIIIFIIIYYFFLFFIIRFVYLPLSSLIF